jgi:hypothetical protein
VICNIHVSFSIDTSHLFDPQKIIGLYFPNRSAVDTFQNLTFLAGSPLLETRFVHIIAARGFAPHQLVFRTSFGNKLEIADGTFSVGVFPFAVLVLRGRGLGRNGRCMFEYIPQLC